MKGLLGGGKKDSVEPTGASAALLIAEKTTKNESLCKSMPLKHRIYGWLTCICVGMIVTFFSSGTIRTLSNGEAGLIKFSILYIIGTCCAFGSSLFLWGPVKQCKSMFDKTRRVVTCVYLGAICCIVILVTCRFVFKDNITLGKLTVPLLLILIVIQYCAYFWYTLSFIPFGRKVFCKCLKKQVGEDQ